MADDKELRAGLFFSVLGCVMILALTVMVLVAMDPGPTTEVRMAETSAAYLPLYAAAPVAKALDSM